MRSLETQIRALAFVLAWATAAAAQTPAPIDTSRIGPQVGDKVPALSGIDQFGTPRTLESSIGAKGGMLVFFRSADW